MDISRSISLHLPSQIEIGKGASAKVGHWAGKGMRIFILAQPITASMVSKLQLSGDVEIFEGIDPEPKDIDLNAAMEAARTFRPDLVVGLGGGSVMDVAKLVAALWNSNQTLDEVVGPNKISGKSSPLALIATTSGTGSESGIRALITNSKTNAKMAVESPFLRADLAVLDPDLTMSLPPAVTAATGVDALAHCVEAFTNINSHPVVDEFARMGMRLAGKFLIRAVQDGADVEARAGMLLASFYGGLCLGPVNTAAGHALAYPLGSHAGLPHGISNAIIFPHVLAFNTPVETAKTKEILNLLGLSECNDQAEVLAQAHSFCTQLGISMSLENYGISSTVLRAWAEEAHGIRRLMDNNPRDMSIDQAEDIYKAAF